MSLEAIRKDLERQSSGQPAPTQEERAKAVVSVKSAHAPTVDRREEPKYAVIDARAPKPTHWTARGAVVGPEWAGVGAELRTGTDLVERERQRAAADDARAKLAVIEEQLKLLNRLCPIPIELLAKLERDVRSNPADAEWSSIWAVDRSATVSANGAAEIAIANTIALASVAKLIAEHLPGAGAAGIEIFDQLRAASQEHGATVRAVVFGTIRDALREVKAGA
jgi:hypothetical protein